VPDAGRIDVFESPGDRIGDEPSRGNSCAGRHLLHQIETEVETWPPEPETQVPTQKLDGGESETDRDEIQLQWFDVARTLVCEVVLRQLPRDEEERHKSSPEFSIKTQEVIEQIMEIV
jgi:hypothetical protein